MAEIVNLKTLAVELATNFAQATKLNIPALLAKGLVE
jgi:hypothetical protein